MMPVSAPAISMVSHWFCPAQPGEAQLASLNVPQRLALLGRFTSHGRKLKPLADWLLPSTEFSAFNRLVYCVLAYVASVVLPSRVAMYLYDASPISAE